MSRASSRAPQIASIIARELLPKMSEHRVELDVGVLERLLQALHVPHLLLDELFAGLCRGLQLRLESSRDLPVLPVRQWASITVVGSPLVMVSRAALVLRSVRRRITNACVEPSAVSAGPTM